jgi:hypothetical protein
MFFKIVFDFKHIEKFLSTFKISHWSILKQYIINWNEWNKLSLILLWNFNNN